jgi:glyoxylase-like metal-dependent hydrolase (beta-lactamase superfamily II)
MTAVVHTVGLRSREPDRAGPLAGASSAVGAVGTPTVPVDPWVLRHLLLSVEDRPRDRDDAAALDAVVRQVCATLLSQGGGPVFAVPLPSSSPARAAGIAAWLFETNSWVLAPDGDGGDCVVVDLPPEVGPLLGYVAAHHLRIAAVLLTHGHLDHAGGIGQLHAAVGDVPVFIHERDVGRAIMPQGSDRLIAQALKIPAATRDALRTFTDGARLVVADLRITAVHTPGHTAGTTCFLVDAHDAFAAPLLLTGDQLFATGAGRCDLAGGCAATMARSMQRRVAPFDDGVIVLPGHGRATTIGEARRVNPRLRSTRASR